MGKQVAALLVREKLDLFYFHVKSCLFVFLLERFGIRKRRRCFIHRWAGILYLVCDFSVGLEVD